MLSIILQDGKGTKLHSPVLYFSLIFNQKHSKDILNFSAMRAIVSALHSVERLRNEIKADAPDLGSMARLSHTQVMKETQRNDRPYLHSLRMSRLNYRVLLVAHPLFL